jgi:DNA-binding transcriptional regulator YiaG
MSKMAEVLKEEITRLARKETKRTVVPLARGLTGVRRGLSKILQSLAALEKKVDRQSALQKATLGGQMPSPAIAEGEQPKMRLSSRLLKKLRKRLKISQGQLARLLAVSQPAVASWEQGRARPREATRLGIVTLRTLSPAQVREKLASLKAARRKPAPKTKGRRVQRRAKRA